MIDWKKQLIAGAIAFIALGITHVVAENAKEKPTKLLAAGMVIMLCVQLAIPWFYDN